MLMPPLGEFLQTIIDDIENRLISASGGHSATLAYDPLGRLYSVSGSSSTNFIYDGDTLAEEADSNGNILRRYISGIGEDKPIAWYEGSAFADSNARYMRADHEGSVIIVADSTTANVYGINTYNEYGAPSGSNIGRFQYTGQMWLPEVALYYYRARMYSPTMGRFMQTDPIGYTGGLDLYTYVGGDPVDQVDPMGTDATNGNVVCPGAGPQDCGPAKPPVQPNSCSRPGSTSCGGTYGILEGWGSSLVAGLKNYAAEVRADWGDGPSIGELIDAMGPTPVGGIVGAGEEAAQLGSAAAKSAIGVGEHAGESIAARSAARDFTAAERSEINRIGSETGCHTCGTKNPGTKSANFVPDHQPPSSLNAARGPQRLYPHCVNCARRQGGEVLQELIKRGDQ
jgi:RHS repeat-associated protein